MIQTSKDARILHLLASTIPAACGNPEDPIKFAKQDMPLTVRVVSVKGGLEIADEHHAIPCEFSKGAIFWFKMDNPKMSIKDLKDQALVLNEYAPASLLTDEKDVKICLRVFSFTLLPKEEAKEVKSPSKGPKDVTKDKEMEPLLDMLRRAHLRHALMKRKEAELPNLEDLLCAPSGKASGRKMPSQITEVKGDKEGAEAEKAEDKIVEFNEIDKVEKSISDDVELLIGEEETKKGQIEAGSEGNVKRIELLEAIAPKLKDQHLVELLKNRGVLMRKWSPSKASPKKKGRMPEDLKEAVKEAVKKAAGVKKEKGTKRKKAEGKKTEEGKGEKKAAVEEDGKKGSATKAKKAGYTLRTKEGKKKAAK